jgi:hypothetical protein
MSWAITGDWLGVAALIFATFGTGAQAWANLAEFKSLRQVVRKEVAFALWHDPPASSHYWSARISAAAARTAAPGAPVALTILGFMVTRALWLRLKLWFNLNLLFRFPQTAARIRAQGGDDAVRLAQFIRLTEVWGILMVGSAFALAEACIQLALA